jgi:hypothetical protein
VRTPCCQIDWIDKRLAEGRRVSAPSFFFLSSAEALGLLVPGFLLKSIPGTRFGEIFISSGMLTATSDPYSPAR